MVWCIESAFNGVIDTIQHCTWYAIFVVECFVGVALCMFAGYMCVADVLTTYYCCGISLILYNLLWES